jgi:hypothetical protein
MVSTADPTRRQTDVVFSISQGSSHMTHTVQPLRYLDVASPEATAPWGRRARDTVRGLCVRVAASLNAHAASWGKAVLYEELSKLSDAELERRGLNRGDLRRWVSEA